MKKIALQVFSTSIDDRKKEINTLNTKIQDLQLRYNTLKEIASIITIIETDLEPWALIHSNPDLTKKLAKAQQAMFRHAMHYYRSADGWATYGNLKICYYMPKLELTADSRQEVTLLSYLMIIALRNKGCIGKYDFIYDGEKMFDFYTTRKTGSVFLPYFPYIIPPEKKIELIRKDGQKPNFELVGYQAEKKT